jgi:hypothetical protein
MSEYLIKRERAPLIGALWFDGVTFGIAAIAVLK